MIHYILITFMAINLGGNTGVANHAIQKFDTKQECERAGKAYVDGMKLMGMQEDAGVVFKDKLTYTCQAYSVDM